MSLISKDFTFSNGAVIYASEHNSNYDTIFNDYNGNITTANISASANIPDTKLAQITTASKVSGLAITSLPSIPSNAGLIPMVNLANGTTGSATTFLRGDSYLGPIATLYSYLNSTTASSLAALPLKVAYGIANLVNSPPHQTITNLPFTSATSYQVFCTASSTDVSGARSCNAVINSASQFTIYVFANLTNVQWLAVGT